MNLPFRSLLAVLTVAVVSLTGACGSDNAKNAGYPSVASSYPTSAPSSTLPDTAAPDHIGQSPADPYAATPTYGTPAALDFSRLNGEVPVPAKQQLAGSSRTPIDGVSYALSVYKSYRDFWAKYFESRQLSMPRMNFDLVSPGDVSTTPCHTGPIGQNYPAMLYCAQTDHIIIPMTLLTHQWSGGSRRVGDLAAAIAVARNSSNSLIASLSDQLGVDAPGQAAQLYVGMCLTGVWARSVYPQNAFTDKELQTALTRSGTISFELNGTKATANSELLTTAWISGFRSGRPDDCATNFWMRTS